VLEIGCGEGTNMEVLAGPEVEWIGCDLSELAARRATERGAAVIVADAERLPVAPGSLDAVVAISVVEHLPHPEPVLEQAMDVLAPGGRLLILSPQYGGPLGASPCRSGGGGARFLRRLLAAHLPAGEGAALGWDRVDPAVLAGRDYDGDMDTVVEPELRSLERFLVRRGLRIVDSASGFAWRTWRTGRMSPGQRFARGLLEPLGRLGVPPYRRFGPLVAICAERPSATPIP
jgi:SAM-dependent methyltransferase